MIEGPSSFETHVISSRPDIVQGWKNIAAYVDRDVSTVKRWERHRGLPVRRMPGAGRANVYAHAAELSGWLGGLEKQSLDREVVVGSARPEPAFVEQAPVASGFGRGRYLYSAVGMVLLVCAVGVAYSLRHWVDQAPVTKRPGPPAKYVSPVAGVQDTLLRGEYLYEQRTPDTMRLALACFQEAIAKDPADAPAWAALADAYLLMHEYGVITLDEAYPMLKAAAGRAMALDAHMSEPHSALGYADFFWMMDAPAAEREFATAIRLNPGSATAHSRYGAMLTYEARFPQALEELNLAQRLEPRSTAILANRAFALGLSGHRDEAVNLLEQVGYNDRNASVLHHLKILGEMSPRNIPLFLEQAKRLSDFRHDAYSSKMYGHAEGTFRASGEAAMWRELLVSTERATPEPNTVTLEIPRYKAFLGEDEEALADLERLAEAHNAALAGILVDPAFAGMHQDPRFLRLVAKAGLAAGQMNASVPQDANLAEISHSMGTD